VKQSLYTFKPALDRIESVAPPVWVETCEIFSFVAGSRNKRQKTKERVNELATLVKG